MPRITSERPRLKLTPSILSATSRLFSSAVVRDLAMKGRSALFARLAVESGLADGRGAEASVADLFEAAFAVLRQGASRDEYIYRAALTHKILLGKHSLRTACMLSEFRVGPCKADLVILNGTATVYEIKSERDSLSRLERQLDAYRRVFPSVVVIAGENHVEDVLSSVGTDIGVMRLSRRHTISVVKAAVDRPDQVDPVAVFETLRTDEAKALLAGLGLETPDLPNTRLHAALRQMFAGLEPHQAHVGMVRVLKQKRDLRPLSDLINRLPQSLQPAALSVPLRQGDHDRLVEAVATPVRDAMAWA